MREALAVAVVAVLGAIALATTGALVTTDRAFTLGVLSSTPGPGVEPGQTACQGPITVPPGGSFDTVDFKVGNFMKPAGPPVEVVVRSVRGELAPRRGVLPAGYPDVGVEPRQRVRVGEVPEGSTISVCFRSRGPGSIALFGGVDVATRQSSATFQGRKFNFDYDLIFRTEDRSLTGLVGDMARRASLFRPPWLTPGVYYALFLVLLIGVPTLLARAARDLRAP